MKGFKFWPLGQSVLARQASVEALWQELQHKTQTSLEQLQQLRQRVHALETLVHQQNQEYTQLQVQYQQLLTLHQNSLQTHQATVQALQEFRQGVLAATQLPLSHSAAALLKLIRVAKLQPGSAQLHTPASPIPFSTPAVSASDLVEQTKIVMSEQALDTQPLEDKAPLEDTDTAQAADAPAPSPHEILQHWYQKYPQIFNPREPKPLKKGIHKEFAQLEGLSDRQARRVLSIYVNLNTYLRTFELGAVRIDSQGQPTQESIQADEVEYAQQKLAQRKQKYLERQAARKAQQETTGDVKHEKPKSHPRRFKAKKVPVKKTAASQPQTKVTQVAEANAEPQLQDVQDPQARMQQKLQWLLEKNNRK
ncbi:sRNA-binding protein [Allopseudospirillum japonicum]|uniref:SRNA-binding protein n=1 Tax=Allopseudospirillum japonicum TaxID=64971 RepID=A0A1H6SRE5_9GAMM|nr:ProQ/FINO family protein [Allopseudospirillum japonicum]SEI70433.1 sRNA-binding protein [Allopseudospirillum japonicum]